MNPEIKEDTCENEKPEPDVPTENSLQTDETPAQTAQEIYIQYQDTPTPQGNREIHPRQTIPPVPEAEENVCDDTPSPPVEID
jgi:hypothetical protein